MAGQDWNERDVREAFFPVRREPVFVRDDNSRDGFQRLIRFDAIIDSEREYTFAVVTEEYDLITNEAAYKLSETVFRRVFAMTNPKEMGCLNIIMPKTRSFCHIDLIHRSSEFTPFPDDPWIAFIRVTNSYNRTHKLKFELGFCRGICLNGIIFEAKSVEISKPHTRQASTRIENFEDNIGDIRALERELTENMRQLERYYVP